MFNKQSLHRENVSTQVIRFHLAFFVLCLGGKIEGNLISLKSHLLVELKDTVMVSVTTLYYVVCLEETKLMLMISSCVQGFCY